MTALLIQLLRYGWQPLRELWQEGGTEEILFEQRNKSYGAYELRRNEGWYLLTALGIVVGFGGTLLLGSLWWSGKKAVASHAICIIPYCPVPPPIASVSFAPLPNVYPNREGEGRDEDPKERFSPPVPRPIVPHYGPGIGNAQDDKLDGWLLPDLPGEDEEVPAVVQNLEGEIIPNVTACFFPVDEEARPINLKEVVEMMKFQGMGCRMIEGVVIARVFINKKGEYESHHILDTDHSILSKEVEKYIDKLRFIPCIREGKPIKSWVNIPFRFKLMN